MARERVSSLRAAVCVAGLLAGSVVATAVLAWATRWVRADSAGGDADFDMWVGRLAACGAWLAVLWLTLGFLVAVIAAVRGSAGDLWERLATRIAPAAVRRAAQFAAGSLLMSGTVVAAGVPAVADSLSPPTPVVSELPDLDRRFLPGAETTEGEATALPTSPNARQPRSPGAHPADAEHHPAPHVVTVGAGDTLWDIAADRLGQDATTADIAAAWRRWFVANRQVIGDDPDLIYPGERLAPP